MIPSVLNEESSNLVYDKIVNENDCGDSDREIETFESMIYQLKTPQVYEDGAIILVDLNELEMGDLRFQVLFRRSRHNNLLIFLISQEYRELPKRTFRANGNICHIFKPNNSRVVQKHYQDKATRVRHLLN